MSLKTVNNGIQNYFATDWQLGSNTPIAYQNIDYDSKGIDEWVRLSIFWDDQEQASKGLGCTFQRYYGSVIVQIYTPVNHGMNRGLELASEVIDILTARTIEGAVLDSAGAAVMGQTNNWHQINVACDFFYDLQLSVRD